MTGAERLAEARKIAQKIVDDAFVRFVSNKPQYDSVDLGEGWIAALIRSQAEELERLREFVRSLRDHKNPDLWFLEEPARAALGETKAAPEQEQA